MATTKEVIELLIRADAKGAEKELNRIGASSSRLGKDADKLDQLSGGLTRFGAVAVGVGAAATAGLYNLADSASAVSEQLSAADVNFGDAADSVADFAKEASKTAGIAQADALRAANRFAAFGRQAGLTGEDLADFSTQMVQTAGDLASFVDIPVDDALTAITSGLAGEQEALRRYGVDVSNAALQNEIFEQTGQKVTGTLTAQQKVFAANIRIQEDLAAAQGDFVRTGDSLANQQRTLAAEFENTKAALGESLAPAFAGMLENANGLLESFNGLDDSTKGLVGKLAGLGAAATLGLGGLALVAGQAIKLRDVFTTVDDGTRSLNKFGKAAKGAGLALGAFAALEIGASVINEITGASDRAEDALLEFQASATKSNDDLIDSFNQLAISEQQIRGTAFFEKFAGDIGLVSSDAVVNLNRLDNAIDKAFDQDPAVFEQTVAAFVALREEGGLTAGELHAVNVVIDRMSSKAELNQAAIEGAAAANEELAGSGTSVAEAMAENQDAITGASDALNQYNDEIRAMTDPIFGAVDAIRDHNDAQEKAALAALKLSGLRENGAATAEELAEAERELEQAQLDAVVSAADQESALLELASQMATAGTTQEDFTHLLRGWVQQGAITQGQADLMAGAFGVVATRADEAAAAVNQDYNPRVNTTGLDRLVTKFGEVQASAIRARDSAQAAVLASLSGGGDGKPRALGGPVDAGQPYFVGETGKEIFVPGVDGTIIPNHNLPKGGDGASVGGGSVNVTYQISVAALDPRQARDAVMEAVFEYENANGSRWRE